MPELTHIKGVDAVLKKLAIKAGQNKSVTVVVGYTADYALGVHENIEMRGKGLPRSGGVKFAGYDTSGRRMVRIIQGGHGGTASGTGKGFFWDPQGQAQAKFLEQPAREKRREIVNIIREIVTNTGMWDEALVFAGLFLQRESQLLVPIDTGHLKASAFTKKETNSALTMHSPA